MTTTTGPSDEIPLDRQMKIGPVAKLLRLSIGTLRIRAALPDGHPDKLRCWQHQGNGFRYFDRQEVEALARKWGILPAAAPAAASSGGGRKSKRR